MKTDEEVKAIIERAKQIGCASVEIDGVTYNLYKGDIILDTNNTKEVPDLEAAQLITPLSPFDEMSDDEILYWSVGYYDDLKQQKELRMQQIKDGEIENG
jgi:hypothetical protein